MGFDWTSRVSFREYSSPYISKLWADWPGMGLPIYPRSCFGLIEPGLCFGLLWRGVGAIWSLLLFWVGEWNIGTISLSPSVDIDDEAIWVGLNSRHSVTMGRGIIGRRGADALKVETIVFLSTIVSHFRSLMT